MALLQKKTVQKYILHPVNIFKVQNKIVTAIFLTKHHFSQDSKQLKSDIYVRKIHILKTSSFHKKLFILLQIKYIAKISNFVNVINT